MRPDGAKATKRRRPRAGGGAHPGGGGTVAAHGRGADLAAVMIYWAHPTAIIDRPVAIGAATKIWHFSHVMPHARIGARCSLAQNVFVATGAVVGDGCRIQNNVSVYEGVEL